MPKRSSKKAEPDVNELAHDLVRRSTETEDEPAPSKSEISRIMAAMGRRGGKKGGKARLITMTPQERSEAAHKAATARWKRAKDQG